MPLNLYDREGHRKYLTAGERAAFLKAAEDAPREVRTLCGTLLYTGCRISEALALTADRVDMKDRRIIFESLKKRQRGVFRPVPVPPFFLDTLDLVHNIRLAQRREGRRRGAFLWSWCRTTAWTRVCEVMQAAKIEAPTPRPMASATGSA